MADLPDSIEIPLTFIGADDTPVTAANSFVVQHQADEFMITVGHVAPPLLVGTPQEQARQAGQLPFIPVNVLGRYSVTRQRLVELIEALQSNLKKFDAKHEES
jgi:hypothetical protein